MAEKTYLVIYKGYVGDAHWGGFRGIGGEIKSPIPNAKMTCLKYVDWLAQKGFGPGYYNNSGRYAVTFKVKSDVDLYDALDKLGVEFFDAGSDMHRTRWNTLKAHAKRQNKLHPY